MTIVTFAVSMIDKYCAVNRLRRVPESTMLVMCFLGGTLGAKAARLISGHKRLKIGYSISLTLIAFFQLGVAGAVWLENSDGGAFAISDVVPTAQHAQPARPEGPRRFGPGS